MKRLDMDGEIEIGELEKESWKEKIKTEVTQRGEIQEEWCKDKKHMDKECGGVVRRGMVR